MPKTFYKCLLASLLLSSFAPHANAAKKPQPGQPRFASSDLGRVFSATIDTRGPLKHTVNKALAIRLGDSLDDGNGATVLFDTELLQFSAAATDRFVLFNTYRDGLGGAGHSLAEPYIFSSKRTPGWAFEGKFDDPRLKKDGPLPSDWAKYRGMYRNGSRAVVSYTVGNTGVLDSPWIEGQGDTRVVTRTIEVAPATDELLLKVCEIDGAKGEVQTANGKSWLLLENKGLVTAIGVVPDAKTGESVQLQTPESGRVTINIAKRTTPASFKVSIFAGTKENADKFVADLKKAKPPESLEPLTEAGPAQWPEPYITEGTHGKGEGPYVIDTFTAPYDNAHKALMRFAGHDFFKNGDAAVCAIDGDVWRVSGLDGDLKTISWKRYATGLFQPLGLKIVDNTVYVLGRDQITRLHDDNGDNETDFYECFNNGCKIGKHVHEYTVCLETDPQGNFYYVKGNNGGQTEHDGSMIRVSKDGSKFEIFATGFRWPNGAGVGPDGTATVADQQGTWVPSSRLDIVKKGGFYGYMNAHHRETKPETYDGPLTWIPHKVDNSCGGQAWISGDRWGLPPGQMIHLSYGRCGMFLVVQDKVGDVDQGGVVPFGLLFASGAMRGRFREKDGQFYVSGLKGWQTSAAKDGCFQRVRYTGNPVHMPTELKVHKNGLLITFAEPVDRASAGNWENWGIEHWNYRWTSAYGSKEYTVSDPKKTGHDELEVGDVYVSKDGKTVFVEVEEMQPVMQMMISYNIVSNHGKPLKNSIYNTIHTFRPEIDPKTVGELVE